ncbi:MAG: sulfatase-like hydrolase/transferase [Helicobacteraceae bacterium]|nr:sulfatase-like hydrolase/transferase [Helicobacteraceae bacterium]
METTYLDIAAYRYANNAFGDFLDKLKDSKLKDKVIVFATGDHKFRVLKSLNLNSIVGDYGVPLYIYLPLAYQKQLAKNNIKINFNIARVGSHKDIFPTLFELTLSNVKYISLGGRNILSPNLDSKYEFGIHSNIWIDKSGAYQNNLLFQWAKNGNFKNIKDLIQTQEVGVEIDVNLKSEFKDDYDKLNRMQLNYRLKGET